MQEILGRKLHDYIQENNPDLLLILQQENKVTTYLQENVSTVEELVSDLLQQNKPAGMIEELCMDALTKELRPSRFNYLKALLEEEFHNDFEWMEQTGILTAEVINMIAVCDPVFDEFGFSEEKEDDRHLCYAVMGAVGEYLKGDGE